MTICRVTLFKIPKEEDRKTVLALYRTMQKDALKVRHHTGHHLPGLMAVRERSICHADSIAFIKSFNLSAEDMANQVLLGSRMVLHTSSPSRPDQPSRTSAARDSTSPSYPSLPPRTT